MAFVDLQEAIGRVHRQVFWWGLRYLDLDELIVSVVRVRIDGEWGVQPPVPLFILL